jgi:hypothetical protein
MMPRYFFHVRADSELVEDFDGSDFPDISAAREEARLSVIDLVCDSLKSGLGLRLDRSVVIADDGGKMLDEILFADAVLPQ